MGGGGLWAAAVKALKAYLGTGLLPPSSEWTMIIPVADGAEVVVVVVEDEDGVESHEMHTRWNSRWMRIKEHTDEENALQKYNGSKQSLQVCLQPYSAGIFWGVADYCCRLQNH